MGYDGKQKKGSRGGIIRPDFLFYIISQILELSILTMGNAASKSMFCSIFGFCFPSICCMLRKTAALVLRSKRKRMYVIAG